MKRITLLIIPNLLMVFFSLSIHAQTLNESADWPNSDWVITGDYESDADAFEADPTLSGNFAFDDDDAGGNSEDEIAAESPVIDLTEAYNAGETWINFSADYFFRVVNSLESEQEDLLVIEYWDSENSIWVDWSGPIPGTQGSSGATTNDFCSPAKVACNVTKLNIENFSSTQLTGFKYRIRYDDDGQDSSGNGWEYGFCFDAPTIFSQVPPTCLVPTNLEVDNLTSTSADISWTAGDSETDWEVLYGGSGFDVETEGTMINDINGEPEVSISDLSESISYDVYVRAICDEEDTSDWVLLSFYTVPSNDECDNAIELVLNDNLECTLTTAGTTVSATGSDLGTDEESVTGTPNNDVWFTFITTSSSHTISLLNIEAVVGSSTDMGMALYDGTGGCEALALFDDSDPNSFIVNGLTVGETYYLRVYGWASTNSAQTTFDVCVKTPPQAPSNDECDNAIELVLNDNLECTLTTAGTTVSATGSDLGTDEESVTGTPNNDVWFTFTATSSIHPISLLNVEAVIGSSTDMGMALYDGTGGCEALALFDDSDPNSFTATGLTVGETYYLRVYGWASTNSAQATFDVCVKTPPPAPSNDECDNAIELVLNDDEECISTTAGTTVSATGTDDEEITGTPNNDVWFTFTATSSSHPISLSNVEAVMGSSIDMGMALYDGSGGCEALTLFDDSDPNSFTATGLTVGETYYLRVYGWASTNSAQTTFDVCVQTIQCIIPTNVVVNNITDTSVEISWTSNGDESEWEVFYGESGFDFETEGTSVIDDDDTLGEVLDELSPDTQYDVYIRSICGEDSESDWTSVLSFTTNANPVLVSVENPVLSETYCYGNNDFKQWLFQSENGEPLTITFTTGTVEANSSGGTFDDLIIYNGQDNSGDILFDSDLDGSDLEGLSFEASSGFIYMTLDADGSNNCAGNDQTTIDFDVFIEVCETPTNVTIDNITDTTAEVTWTDNAGVTEWEVLYGETGFDPTSEGESMMDNNDELGVILSDLTPETTYDVYVRAICDTDNMSEWTAVEMFITLQDPCEVPTEVVINNITDTTAEVTWTDYVVVTEWEVLYGETGFDPTSEGESMMDNNDELGVILSDLTPETTYDVYVRAICDNDNMSEWTAVESFTTDFLGVNTENFVGFNYYPNPVKNSINLESRLNIDKVSIYNLLGQEVLSRDLNEMSPSLDMSNLASGAYILRVQIGSQSKIIRVIKE